MTSLNRSVKKLLLTVLILLCLLAAGAFLKSEIGALSLLAERVEKLAAGRAPEGLLALSLLYLLSPALMLPTFHLSLISGAAFGPFWGVVADAVGTTVGGLVPLFIARRFLKDKIAGIARFRDLSEFAERNGLFGWRLNGCLRLTMFFPSAVIGYFFGLTRITPGQFALSTFLFVLPSSALAVGFGASLWSLLRGGEGPGLYTGLAAIGISMAAWLIYFANWGKKLSTK